jgi:tetratricopeptide (TPR) repeat protein
MGRKDLGLESLRQAIALDPLNPSSHGYLAAALFITRRYAEAIAKYKDVMALRPHDTFTVATIGEIYYWLGDYQAARSTCEGVAEKDDEARLCLAGTYEKLGRHADAEAMLAKVRAHNGDLRALDYSIIYAVWGNTTEALKWLDTGVRLHDSFQAVERGLRFPQQ